GLNGGAAPPFVRTAAIVKALPAGGVANQDRVDRFGAVAAELFVEAVVTDGVGMAEDGEGSAGMLFAKFGEFLELVAAIGKDERRGEDEAHAIELPAGDWNQLHADGVLAFVGGGGGYDDR